MSMLFMKLWAQKGSGKRSFGSSVIFQLLISISSSPSISGLRKQWCPEIVDLIERMWAHEHQDRPTISEVVEAVQELLAKY
jgi:hypothetical protein